MGKVQRATGSWMCVCTICTSELLRFFCKQQTENRTPLGGLWSLLVAAWPLASRSAPCTSVALEEPRARSPRASVGAKVPISTPSGGPAPRSRHLTQQRT